MARDIQSAGSEHLFVADDVALDVSATITMCIRVNFTTLPTGGKTLLGKYLFSTNQRSYVLQTPGTPADELAWNSSTDGGKTGGALYNVRTNDAALAINIWYAIVVTFNSTVALFYKDGTLLTNTNEAGTPGACFNSTADFNIGAQDDGAAGFLNAQVAEAAVFDYVWTLEQVQGFADGYSPAQISGIQSRAYWPLMRGLSNVDLSGNGNNLTDSGTIDVTDHPSCQSHFNRRFSGHDQTLDMGFGDYPSQTFGEKFVEAY